MHEDAAWEYADRLVEQGIPWPLAQDPQEWRDFEREFSDCTLGASVELEDEGWELVPPFDFRSLYKAGRCTVEPAGDRYYVCAVRYRVRRPRVGGAPSPAPRPVSVASPRGRVPEWLGIAGVIVAMVTVWLVLQTLQCAGIPLLSGFLSSPFRRC